jgi:type I site-specific restriction-modification system R (restriction) subunit
VPINSFTSSSSIIHLIFSFENDAAKKQLNPTLPESARVEAYQKVINLGTSDIMENNERFHTLLTDGVTI